MSIVKVASPNVRYTESHVTARYLYNTTSVQRRARDADVHAESITVTPLTKRFEFRTSLAPQKLGVMLVGWAGNNGSTLTAGILANRERTEWRTKEGTARANYLGSLTQCGTVHLGEQCHIPLKQLLPMADPNQLEIGGWDINSADIAQAMNRAGVLDYDLQRQLADKLRHFKPLPSIYYPDFIAANQEGRADNVMEGGRACQSHLDKLREDIRQFKTSRKLESVMVVWTANTERFVQVTPGVHDTKENILAAIRNQHAEISPSSMFAVAAILENCAFINGSPQNTLVPGILQLAEERGVFVGGDDFKTGQTKVKSVLVDFLVSSGLRPRSIVSYNHLGNNDGRNLSAPQQFRSKEISKTNVVDDMIYSNDILYPKTTNKNTPDHKPDHVVVIKYVPSVGDSKRALDEYVSDIFMGGTNTISMHNVCEDSLLAAPVILDLVILTELFQRIRVRELGTANEKFSSFQSVLSPLSFLVKAPLVPEGEQVVNALFKQRSCIENILRACVGLAPDNNILLETKLQNCDDAKSAQNRISESTMQSQLHQDAKKIIDDKLVSVWPQPA